MRTLILALGLLAACSSGGTTLDDASATGAGGEDGGGDDGGDDGGGDGGDDGGDDGGGDDGSEEPEPSIEDWEGDWIGEIVIEAVEEAYGWDDCEGEFEIDVDDDGEVDGDGSCITEDSGGWGGSDEYDVEFEGEMNADGELEGVLYIDAGYWGVMEAELEGEAEDDDLEAAFDGELTYESNWGDEEYTLELEGELELERD